MGLILGITGGILTLGLAMLIQMKFFPEAPPQNVFIVVCLVFGIIAPFLIKARAKTDSKGFYIELNKLARLMNPLFYMLFGAYALYIATWYWIGGSETRAGIGLIILLATVFNRVPIEGFAVVHRKEFRFFYGPSLGIATLGYMLGFILKQAD